MMEKQYITLFELSQEIGLSVGVLEGIIVDNNVPCVVIGELSHTSYVDKNKILDLFEKSDIVLRDKVEERRKQNIRNCREWYRVNRTSEIAKARERDRRNTNTFDGVLKKHKRGEGNIIKRDYELTQEQLKKRNLKRKYNHRSKTAQYGLLVYYDETLEDLSIEDYTLMLNKEYKRQRRCAINGHIGRTKPSEHFLFDFDLEQMLKDKIKDGHGNEIQKWWNGTIRHWNVNCGIWKEQ